MQSAFNKNIIFGLFSVAFLAIIASFVLATNASAQASESFQANLEALNGSGANGTLMITLDGNTAHVSEQVNGAVAGQPHAQHLHFSTDASHTCPATSADDNGDDLVSSIEARPSYGTPVVSLTTSGDTSAKSALAVSRYPTAENGTITYTRNIMLTDEQVAHLQAGELVAVVHGIDVNGNGKYDTEAGTSPLADAAGVSDSFPLEGTAPTACGVMLAMGGNVGADNGNVSGNNTDNMSSNAMDNDAGDSNTWIWIISIIAIILSIIAIGMSFSKGGNAPR